ncbi:cystathionine gamma-lyase [Aplysia californica]|uniref:Cystathionine gamma-lyase n=1 Tax=Aplysia californica TaxID=6500 RepID=A0ABM0JTF0_APLCA|nr:cystathionine gamma-lyase [Aplysia californica]
MRKSVRHTPAKSNYDVSLKGLSLDDVRPETAVISSHHHFEGTATTPLVPPIYHSSTYFVEKLEDVLAGIEDGGSIYSRLSNPTTEATEATINVIERGAGCLTFSSGMAAITSVFFGFLKAGDHVVFQIPSYPGTSTALKHLRDHFQVELTTVGTPSVENVTPLLKPNTKLVWIESPCNPEIVLVDIAALADLCRSRNILIGVDGTFASPVLQHSIQLGVDFAMHSSTKYMGGHSDLIAGCVTTRTVDQWRALKHIQGTLGNMLQTVNNSTASPQSPHDASLLLRGLKTLPMRMERISQNALKVATFLENHPKVARVSYPGLKSHPQHEIAERQMSQGCGGMIMAEIKGGEKGGRVVAENMRVVRLAVSLGGVESILEHPYSMTHGKYLLSPEEIAESGITPGMLRISIGLEDSGDLINDFDQALAKLEL